MIKRSMLGAFSGLVLISCAQADESTPVPKPEPTPIEIVDGSQGESWRKINPDHILVLNTRHGEIFIELNPEFAPGHTARMIELAEKRALNNTKFYRVIDGFVAQGGLNEEGENWPNLEIEIEQPIGDNTGVLTLDNDDLFAEEVGFQNGFPIGLNRSADTKWLLHCPGAVAMARNTDPDSGGTDFYIVLDAQRYLDRNLTVFGRVLSGMEFVQKLQRGDKDVASGVIQAPKSGDQIFSAKILSSMPEDTRPSFEVMKSDASAFKSSINSQRNRRDPFFFNTPPEVIDVCDVDIPTKQID